MQYKIVEFFVDHRFKKTLDSKTVGHKLSGSEHKTGRHDHEEQSVDQQGRVLKHLGNNRLTRIILFTLTDLSNGKYYMVIRS